MWGYLLTDLLTVAWRACLRLPAGSDRREVRHVNKPCRLKLSDLYVRLDGTIYTQVTCEGCGEVFETLFAPSVETGSAFGEHLVLVATTFVTAFANRRLGSSPPAPAA